MIMRIAGSENACVACQVSENREAESGSSAGLNVWPIWRIAARSLALAGAAPESTITTPSPPIDTAMLPPAPAII